MPGKKFQAHLENLFSNSIPAEINPEPLAGATFPGWVWECDHQGKITYCSPEVEQALGVQATEFISQSLLNYRLPPESAESMAQLLRDVEQPKGILTSYKHQSGAMLPVNLYVLGKWVDEDGHSIVRGFSQLQLLEETPVPKPDLQTQAPTDTAPVIPDQSDTTLIEAVHVATDHRKTKIGSQLILEMLKHLKQTTKAIREAKNSHILITTIQESVENTAPGKERIEYLFGKRVITYPSVTVNQLVHRLEWGNKLDLTESEKEFVMNNRFQAGSLLGKIRQQLGNKTILKADKSWIGVIIQTVGNQPASIVLQSNADLGSVNQVTLDDFIHDPLVLMPNLRQAIVHPKQSNEALKRGVDFLIHL